MDVRDILLAITAFASLIVGLFTFFSNKKSEANIVYSLFTFWVALWALGLFMFRFVTSLDIAYFWNQEFIFVASLIANSFLHFSFVYPLSQPKLSNIKRFLIYLPAVFVLLGVIIPGPLIKEVVDRDWGRESVLGVWYPVYGLYFGALMVWAFINLYRSRQHSQKEIRIRLNLIIVGLLISIIFGSTFNLIFILLGNYRYVWLGPYATFIMVLTIALAVYRHGFLNVRVIATEIFSVAVATMLLVELLLSKTAGEWLLRGFFLIAFIYLSFELIRSVLREVRQREHIEKLYRKLSDANRHLKELMDIKTEFLQIASHQLRTPLTSLRGLLEMQAKGDFVELEEKERKELQTGMLGSANQLNNIVNDLLDAMELEGGDLNFEFAKIDAIKLIQEAVDVLKPSFDKKGLTISFQKPVAILEIEADERYLRQVFLNIINNAEKYTEKGGLTIKATADGGKITVLFADTGMGVDSKESPKLFRKFVRGKRSALVHTDGSGLGLYIIKKIVDEHRGRVVLESKGVGQGTTVRVELPVKQPN